MAVTQNELVTALTTFLATNPVRLAMRSGLLAELDLADLVVGEIAVATDTLQVWICTSLGTVIPLTGLTILGYYANAGALATAHPTGTAGQIYLVGSAPMHTYTWDGSAWADMGAMNDTSTFATLASPTFTGTVVLPATTTIGSVTPSDLSPVGEIKIWSTATAPSKHLICNGAAISRTTYAALFEVISTLYGVGDGTTTFNLPNLKGKVVVGVDASQTEFDALGEIGGAKTHTLAVTEMPIHKHDETQYSFDNYVAASGSSMPFATSGATNTTVLDTLNAGGGLAHNNLQPYIAMYYIIRALA